MIFPTHNNEKISSVFTRKSAVLLDNFAKHTYISPSISNASQLSLCCARLLPEPCDPAHNGSTLPAYVQTSRVFVEAFL